MNAFVTGHRPNRLGSHDPENPIRVGLRRWLSKQLRKYDVKRLYVGMALGFDQDSAEVCIAERIPFIACLPCLDQDRLWPDSPRDYYDFLLGKAADIHVVSAIRYETWAVTRTGPDPMKLRNHYMVDHSERGFAAWSGAQGGTCACLIYAHQKEVPVSIIHPNSVLLKP